jgi:Carboxypeptidase regulatory-like domain
VVARQSSQAATERIPAPARRPVEPRTVPIPQRRPRRSPVRNAVVAFASAGVLALLVLYAIAAPSASLSASAGSVVPLPGSTAVVLGRVLSSSGGGLKGARVDVHRPAGQTVEVTSNAAGAFRAALPGSCAVYTVSIHAPAQGSTVAATVTHRLCPGDALPVDAHVVTQGQFLWIPGPR